MIQYTASYTDHYQLSMALVFYKSQMGDGEAVYDYFFRKLPFKGGYVIFAGLEDLLSILEDFRFSDKDLSFLHQSGFPSDFLQYLKDFRFTGNIYSSTEGDIVFPHRPVLSVEAGLAQAQIVETVLLNILNFQSLIATRAGRIRHAAGGAKLIDFGLRRAHGPGGYYASRAAIIGGFQATSNVRAGCDYHIPVTGTMAHSLIQAFDSELDAFRTFARWHPGRCVLLVDTYDTLGSGLPNAIKVAKEMEQRGQKLSGIRLDSGDLAYLSAKAREKLDKENLHYVKIAVSNQLDEYVINSLKQQKAPIDVFGVGTSLVTGQPDAALDGVYKQAFANKKPRIKLSETINKTTLPHKKQVYRLKNDKNNWIGGDVVSLWNENPENILQMHHPFEPGVQICLRDRKKEPLLNMVMENGIRVSEKRSVREIQEYNRERMNLLPREYKRFINPHAYKIGLSTRLIKERNRLADLQHRTDAINRVS